MKTRKSNLKETTVKTARIFTTVFVTFLVLSVSALASNTNSAASNLKNLFTEEKDAESNVEEWMLNANNFYFDFTLEGVTEAELEIESWMVNESNFESHFNLETATETAMEVENWMTDASYFGMANYLETETEESLNIEAWMLNDSLFSKKDKNKTKVKEKSKSENESNVLAEVKTGTNKKAVGVTNSKTQFGRRAMILIEDEDPKLKMEQWMLDYRHWKTK
jgi:hypothetical protein